MQKTIVAAATYQKRLWSALSDIKKAERSLLTAEHILVSHNVPLKPRADTTPSGIDPISWRA